MDPVGLVLGLVRGDREELADHESSLGGVQIELAITDDLDPD